MKKIFTLFSALAVCLTSFAQITITAAHMPQLNDQIPRAQDTLTNHQPGPSGSNQTWVFLNNTVHNSPTTTVVTPASTPHASDFTSSNQAYTNDNTAYVYMNLTANALYSDGAAGDLLMNGDNIVTVFDDNLLLHNFPKTYGDVSTDFYKFDAQADGSSFSVNAVWLFHEGTVFDTVDGWGTITTPTGTYDCLRQKHIEHSYDSLLFRLLPPPLGSWTTLSVARDTSVSYSWLALETKLNVAELSFDTLGNPKNFTWSLIPPLTTSVENIDGSGVMIYPNPANDFVSISTPEPTENCNLNIWDSAGRLVRSTTTSSNTKISVEDLEQGIYLYELRLNDKSLKHGKLMIER